MYFVAVLVPMVFAPLVSVLIAGAVGGWEHPLLLIGTWWVFWGIGVRLTTAGISQIVRPGFTAKNILGIDAPEANVIVQELGFANVAMGLAGLISLAVPSWAPAVGFVGGLFLFIAGVRHVGKSGKNAKEWMATATDLLVGVIGLGFAAASVFGWV